MSRFGGVVDIDPASEDDNDTVIFVAGNSRPMTGAGNSKVSAQVKSKPMGVKITPKNIRETGMTLRQLIDLKPAKNIVKEFFKMRIENLEDSDEEEEEDYEEEKPKKPKKK
jgi:hypothetical protein